MKDGTLVMSLIHSTHALDNDSDRPHHHHK